MLLNLSLFTLICLLLFHLLPQGAQSSRARFLSSHPRHHPHRHPHASPPSHGSSVAHIHMVTGSDQQQMGHQHDHQLDIAMVTGPVQEFGGMLRTTVPATNLGANSQNLAAMGLGNLLNTQVSGPNPGGNSQSFHVAGPNPNDNSNSLAGMLDSVSGPNPGGNSNTLVGSMLVDTPVSGPNPGGNSEGLYVSEPNTGGHGKTSLAGKDGNSMTLAGMLDTPVSGPNPGGNSNTLVGSMLDTPVSGPNPGGNSEGLYVSEPSKGGHGQQTSLAGKFDKPPASGGVVPQGLTVSRDADRHANAVLTSMLDATVSGPNPGGNSATLGDMLDTTVSGPNPGGNSEVLAAVSGSQRLAASSGPNPGGNSEILAASSGPNPGGHSAGLTSSDDSRTTTRYVAGFNPSNAVPIGEKNMVILSAVSGPNPGHNSAIYGSSKFDASTLERLAQSASSPGSNRSRNAEIWHAAGGTLFGELPRVPVPPSGPSPIHNSVGANQGLFAERKLRGEPIGCEQDGAGGAFYGQLGAYTNTFHGMGAAASLNSS